MPLGPPFSIFRRRPRIHCRYTFNNWREEPQWLVELFEPLFELLLELFELLLLLEPLFLPFELLA